MLFLGCVLIEVVVYYFPDSNQQPQLESNPRTKCSNSNISEYFQQGQFPMGWTIMLKKKKQPFTSPHTRPNPTKRVYMSLPFPNGFPNACSRDHIALRDPCGTHRGTASNASVTAQSFGMQGESAEIFQNWRRI